MPIILLKMKILKFIEESLSTSSFNKIHSVVTEIQLPMYLTVKWHTAKYLIWKVLYFTWKKKFFLATMENYEIKKDGHYLLPLLSQYTRFRQNLYKGYWDTASHTFYCESTESKHKKWLFFVKKENYKILKGWALFATNFLKVCQVSTKSIEQFLRYGSQNTKWLFFVKNENFKFLKWRASADSISISLKSVEYFSRYGFPHVTHGRTVWHTDAQMDGWTQPKSRFHFNRIEVE